MCHGRLGVPRAARCCPCPMQARALKVVKETGDALVLEKLKAVGLVMFRDSAEWGGKPVSEWSERRRGAKEDCYQKGRGEKGEEGLGPEVKGFVCIGGLQAHPQGPVRVQGPVGANRAVLYFTYCASCRSENLSTGGVQGLPCIRTRERTSACRP